MKEYQRETPDGMPKITVKESQIETMKKSWEEFPTEFQKISWKSP